MIFRTVKTSGQIERNYKTSYILENQIDILALNETFLKPKLKFHLPGYDMYKNDRLVGTKGGVAIRMKKGIIVNQEWKNEHFNVITDSKALTIEIELQNGEKVILDTIYSPVRNPSLRLFTFKPSNFSWGLLLKHKHFGCVKPNKSGQTLVKGRGWWVLAKSRCRYMFSSMSCRKRTTRDN